MVKNLILFASRGIISVLCFSVSFFIIVATIDFFDTSTESKTIVVWNGTISAITTDNLEIKCGEGINFLVNNFYVEEVVCLRKDPEGSAYSFDWRAIQELHMTKNKK